MAERSQVFIFDIDRRRLDTLAYGFEKAGHPVLKAPDLDTAHALLAASEPAARLLMVIGVNALDGAGLDLIGDSRARHSPCVAYGRADVRPGSVSAGAFAFLTLPSFVKDFVGLSRLIAAAGFPAADPSVGVADAEIVMDAGDIDGIYHLVRILGAISRSAVVEASHGGKRAELRFIDGELVSVEVGSVVGLPALHHILLWRRAELTLKFKNVVRRGNQLSLKPADVLPECDRFLRDFAHEVANLGSSHSVFAPNESRRPAPHMPSEVGPVLRQFDGRRELAQILEDSPFRIFDTLRIIKRFVADEAIFAVATSPVDSSPQPSHLSGPAALDAWFQRSASRAAAAPTQAAQTVGRAEVTAASDPPPTIEAGGRVEEVRTVSERERAAATLKLIPGGTSTPPAPQAPAQAAPPSSLPQTEAPDPSRSRAPLTRPSPGVRRSPTGLEPPANVIHGEIQVTRAATARQTGSLPPAGAPSVFVDLEVNLGALVPGPGSTGPAAEALSRPGRTLQFEAPRAAAVPFSVAAAAAGPAVAAPKIAPLDASRAPRASTSGAPSPIRGHANSTASPATVGGRAQPNTFDDVEADFFDREKDLYRGDSVESFDDLEGAQSRVAPLDPGSQGKP